MPRPFSLDPLFRSLTALPGVGPKNAKLFEKLTGGGKILDLLWHKPADFVDRRYSPKLADAQDGKIVTLELTVQKHFPAPNRGMPYKVWCVDETATINLIFFNAHKDWIEKWLPLNEKVIVSGRVEIYQGTRQMVHPDYIVAPSNRADIESIEPIYPLTAGLTNKSVRKAVQGALAIVPSLEEWLDASYKKQKKWPDWKEAVATLHAPENGSALEPSSPARERLAYDELLANQLSLALVRRKLRRQSGRAWQPSGKLHEKFEKVLPFKLTNAQIRALSEIDADMKSPLRMLRLLQGDVGSGKTVVAAMAMMNVLESGAQAAIMAPTEILARQHAQSFSPWLDALGIPYVILTGRDKGKAREKLLAQIADGSAKVVIGTHAIFQETVGFDDLGLAVIDEQHRFGVHQRLQLSNKGRGVDVLVMTATPIPRTLTLTAYGDMEVSRLDEKPPGRKPIDTLLISNDRDDEMIAGISRQMANGARIYWVCPLVEESELIDLQAAEARHDILKEHFGDQVGLIHGRMKPVEKDEVMSRFAKGDLKILVATTVIEVGVNVPEATVMIIEHAERFGLAQLHQLRGRVGRGAEKSYCFLMYDDRLSAAAKERLKIMRDTEDGFIIAEKDLELRGGGEILGTRQSGLPEFKLADLTVHGELLATARDDTKLILSKYPDLEGPRGNALKTLLYLFEQDQAIANIRAG
ncbi:MAG: ATP-dependent DNA helicase RecG [Micavibrio aeruginosavorus]|uniref:ATP-dependent DNA helicase RecG n=1 Tax=Micavibrio aeruginosavorus TaxID=349221 RepID=A0A2W5NDT3_9BACT|nr:MAG: ATP-dependent DNA helicase RecG [Micavibrio aeruginosavorus]